MCRAPATTQQSPTKVERHDHNHRSKERVSARRLLLLRISQRTYVPHDKVYVRCAGEVAHCTVRHSSRLLHCVMIVVDAALGPHINSHGRSHRVAAIFMSLRCLSHALHVLLLVSQAAGHQLKNCRMLGQDYQYTRLTKWDDTAVA